MNINDDGSTSHESDDASEPRGLERTLIGTTSCGHDEFKEFMSSVFKDKSYDLIRKNCNSFS